MTRGTSCSSVRPLGGLLRGSPFHGRLSGPIWRVDVVQWFILPRRHRLIRTCSCESVRSFLRIVSYLFTLTWQFNCPRGRPCFGGIFWPKLSLPSGSVVFGGRDNSLRELLPVALSLWQGGPLRGAASWRAFFLMGTRLIYLALPMGWCLGPTTVDL